MICDIICDGFLCMLHLDIVHMLSAYVHVIHTLSGHMCIMHTLFAVVLDISLPNRQCQCLPYVISSTLYISYHVQLSFCTLSAQMHIVHVICMLSAHVHIICLSSLTLLVYLIIHNLDSTHCLHTCTLSMSSVYLLLLFAYIHVIRILSGHICTIHTLPTVVLDMFLPIRQCQCHPYIISSTLYISYYVQLNFCTLSTQTHIVHVICMLFAHVHIIYMSSAHNLSSSITT